jgi:Glycosyl hydrolases family 15/Domain of unknown function (DUF5911)
LTSPALGDHRLVGDGRTTALVLPTAEIDWWCCPEPDSPPLLWSLLDGDGAAARWEGAEPVPAYAPPAGPTARTVVRLGGVEVECWDGLLGGGDGRSEGGGGGPGLARLARALDGPLDAVHAVALGGFDAAPPTWDGTVAALPGGRFAVTGGEPCHGDGPPPGGVLRMRVRAPAGQWAAVVIAPPGGEPPGPDELARRFAEADEAERARIAGARLPSVHPERAPHALGVLQACTYAATGAVLAAPTTSLPEAPGHDRQFDYRYTWLRDASLAASVAALLGDLATADRYLRFLVGLGGERLLGAPLHTVRGEPVPPEREVPGVAGWRGSRPVRVGNAAADQVQYDVLGTVVEAVSVHVQQGGPLTDEVWDLVRTVADRAAEPRDAESSGLWELRRPRDLVSADIGRWLALDRAVWIARGWRPSARRRHWVAARREARDRVLAAIRPDGGLPQSYDGEGCDGSALLVVVLRLLDRRDPRAARLVDATLAQLQVGDGPFVRRYPAGTDDGFSGVEGAFVPVSWWAVSALAAVGRVDEAAERADRLCAALPPLIPEEVDPATGEGLGNTPLVWSHMEVARATYLLEVAGIRRRWTVAGLAAWRVATHLSMRRRRRNGGQGRRGVRR